VSTVLVASLGESPIVVTSLVDLLQTQAKERGRESIDIVEVIVSQYDMISLGYDLIREGLADKHKEIEVRDTRFSPYKYNDEGPVSGEEEAYLFLQTLSHVLLEHQQAGNTVYLSLAGGHKSTSTLMALLAPLYPCVKELYHIHYVDEYTPSRQHFLSSTSLFEITNKNDLKRLLFPSHNEVKVVQIPYDKEQRVSTEFQALLRTITEEQITKLWETNAQEAEAIEYYRTSALGRILRVEVTDTVIEKYEEMLQGDATRAKNFGICFEQMHYASRVIGGEHGHGKGFTVKGGPSFHFYKRLDTAERPFFYTEPEDICAKPEAKVRRLVIVDLEIEKKETYKQAKDIIQSLDFPLHTTPFGSAFPHIAAKREHILLIPLGTTPMIATQLYTLFQDRGSTVRKVILMYPKHADVLKAVDVAREAFQARGIEYQEKPLMKFNDIDLPEACTAYQTLVEETIDEVRFSYPDCQLELTIAGGRKGMAALTTFAAQRKDIHYVYHTLITDDAVEKRVSEETTTDELNRIGKRDKNMVYDRLFLRAYEQDKAAFELFRVPVVPLTKG